MIELPRLVANEKILKGKIFNVAVPFVAERPLDFVIEDKDNAGLYKIVTKDDGFEGVINKNGVKTAPVVKIVTDYKLRPAIIISPDKLNTSEDFKDVIVLPITSIYEADKKNPTIKRVIEFNNVDSFHYLGELTGRESYVIVNKPIRLSKNMIFEAKKEIILKDDHLTIILKKLAKCLEINEIEKCEQCEHNCENCSLKLVSNQ